MNENSKDFLKRIVQRETDYIISNVTLLNDLLDNGSPEETVKKGFELLVNSVESASAIIKEAINCDF